VSKVENMMENLCRADWLVWLLRWGGGVATTFSWPLGAVIPLLIATGCPVVVVTPIELVVHDAVLVKSRLKPSNDEETSFCSVRCTIKEILT